MLQYPREANCVKRVDFNHKVPGVEGFEFTNISFGGIRNLPRPLAGPNALDDMRTEVLERASEQARRRRRLDKDKAWEDRQGIEPPAGCDRATFLARGAKLFHAVVTHPVLASLDNHLSSCATHHNYVGDVPLNKMDCDLKEISQEGFCQNGSPRRRHGHASLWT